MVRRAVAEKAQGWQARRYLLACLLGLAVLLGHQLVMASPSHAGDMAMERGQVAHTAMPMQAVAAPQSDSNLHPAVGDQRPPIDWEECFAQEGILPALLLLLTFLGVCWRAASAVVLASLTGAGERIARLFPPPPLEPSRRRALLQVFLI